MKGISLLWSAFGGTWLVFIAFAAWSVREHNLLKERMAEIDRAQAVRMMYLETELKHINTSLLEIKATLK